MTTELSPDVDAIAGTDPAPHPAWFKPTRDEVDYIDGKTHPKEFIAQQTALYVGRYGEVVGMSKLRERGTGMCHYGAWLEEIDFFKREARH